MVKPPKPSDGWRTPEWLARALGRFDLDPCSAPGSHVQAVTAYRLDRGEDGLSIPWLGRHLERDPFAQASVYCNPPYSRPLPWAERLARHGGPWCALVKLDPTTRWWAALMGGGEGWAPFRKRLKFEPPAGWTGKTGMVANFPCALVWGAGWTPPITLKEHLWTRG